MVVVGGHAEQPGPCPQHLVVGLGVVAVQAVQFAAVVVDLHGKDAAQVLVVVVVLQRPVGMVVTGQKAFLVHLKEKVVQAVDVAVALGRLHGGEPAPGGGVGVVEVDVVGAHPLKISRFAEGFVQVRLKGGQGHKGVVGQFGIPAIVAVVGVGHDGIASFLVFGLDLFRGPVAVGVDGVAVQIGFVETAPAGQQFTIFHAGFLPWEQTGGEPGVPPTPRKPWNGIGWKNAIQPLTAPEVMPSTKYFWHRKKARMTGTSTRVAPAIWAP